MQRATMTRFALALLGCPKAVTDGPGDLFSWPITTKEDEAAVLDILLAGDPGDLPELGGRHFFQHR